MRIERHGNVLGHDGEVVLGFISHNTRHWASTRVDHVPHSKFLRTCLEGHTPGAPKVFRGTYSYACCLWSRGVSRSCCGSLIVALAAMSVVFFMHLRVSFSNLRLPHRPFAHLFCMLCTEKNLIVFLFSVLCIAFSVLYRRVCRRLVTFSSIHTTRLRAF